MSDKQNSEQKKPTSQPRKVKRVQPQPRDQDIMLSTASMAQSVYGNGSRSEVRQIPAVPTSAVGQVSSSTSQGLGAMPMRTASAPSVQPGITTPLLGGAQASEEQPAPRQNLDTKQPTPPKNLFNTPVKLPEENTNFDWDAVKIGGVMVLTFSSCWGMEWMFAYYQYLGTERATEDLSGSRGFAIPAAAVLAAFNWIVDTFGVNYAEDAFSFVKGAKGKEWSEIPYGTQKQVVNYTLRFLSLYMFAVLGSADVAALAKMTGNTDSNFKIGTGSTIVMLSLVYYVMFSFSNMTQHVNRFIDLLHSKSIYKELFSGVTFSHVMAAIEAGKTTVSNQVMRALIASLTLSLIIADTFEIKPNTSADKTRILEWISGTGFLTFALVGFQRCLQAKDTILNPEFRKITREELDQIRSQISVKDIVSDVAFATVTSAGLGMLMATLPRDPSLAIPLGVASGLLLLGQSFSARMYQTPRNIILALNDSTAKLDQSTSKLTLDEVFALTTSDIFDKVTLSVKQGVSGLAKFAGFINTAARSARIIGYGGFFVQLAEELKKYGLNIEPDHLQQLAIMMGFGTIVQTSDGHTFYHELMGGKDDAKGTFPYWLSKWKIGMPILSGDSSWGFISVLKSCLAGVSIAFRPKDYYEWDPVFNAWIKLNPEYQATYEARMFEQLPLTLLRLRGLSLAHPEANRLKQAHQLSKEDFNKWLADPANSLAVRELRDDFRRCILSINQRIKNISGLMSRSDTQYLEMIKTDLFKKDPLLSYLLAVIIKKGEQAQFDSFVALPGFKNHKQTIVDFIKNKLELLEAMKALEQFVFRQKVISILESEFYENWIKNNSQYNAVMLPLQVQFKENRASILTSLTEELNQALKAFDHFRLQQKKTYIRRQADEVLEAWLDSYPEHRAILGQIRREKTEISLLDENDESQTEATVVDSHHIQMPPTHSPASPQSWLSWATGGRLGQAAVSATAKAPEAPASHYQVVRDFEETTVQLRNMLCNSNYKDWIKRNGFDFKNLSVELEAIADKRMSRRSVEKYLETIDIRHFEMLRRFHAWEKVKTFDLENNEAIKSWKRDRPNAAKEWDKILRNIDKRSAPNKAPYDPSKSFAIVKASFDGWTNLNKIKKKIAGFMREPSFELWVHLKKEQSLSGPDALLQKFKSKTENELLSKDEIDFFREYELWSQKNPNACAELRAAKNKICQLMYGLSSGKDRAMTHDFLVWLTNKRQKFLAKPDALIEGFLAKLDEDIPLSKQEIDFFNEYEQSITGTLTAAAAAPRTTTNGSRESKHAPSSASSASTAASTATEQGQETPAAESKLRQRRGVPQPMESSVLGSFWSRKTAKTLWDAPVTSAENGLGVAPSVTAGNNGNVIPLGYQASALVPRGRAATTDTQGIPDGDFLSASSSSSLSSSSSAAAAPHSSHTAAASSSSSAAVTHNSQAVTARGVGLYPPAPAPAAATEETDIYNENIPSI